MDEELNLEEDLFDDDDDDFWETEEEVAEGEGFYIDDDGNWIPKDDSPVF